jgi:nitrogen fixation protein
MPDTIDINISPVIETVALTIQPNLTTINVNTITGGGGAVDSVNGQIGVVVLNQDDVLDGTTYKQYSLTEKNKLAGIAAGAEVNVNADWNATTGDAQILNKPTIPSVTNLVPYTGATQNVDLGEFELKGGQLTLDTTPTGTAAVATTRWNDTLGSTETTLKGGSVILKNGVDLLARVVNKVTPNTTLTKAAYQVVKVSGAQGQRLAVDLAQGNTDLNSADTLGVVTETIATNQEGFIITVGQLEGINTTGSLQGETWVDGNVLYLSPTTAGRMTNIKPNGSNGHIVVLGYVEYAHANNGKIYVKIMNGWELDELHNVFISTPLNNQALTYETSTDLWKNKTIIEDSITDGVTDKAPSQNAVFDALATKFTLPALTSGSVLFSNGSTIAQDNANLFWDDSNNRLGIGATSPQARLDVRAQGALSTDIAFRVRNSANTGNMLMVQGNSYVGIGTDTPSRILNVVSNVTALQEVAIFKHITASAAIVIESNTNQQLYCGVRNTAAGGKGYFSSNNGFSIDIYGGVTPIINFFNSGNVTISNVATDVASAILNVDSTTKGFLPPRMTTTQKNAIASPAAGLVVYDSTLGKLCVRTASAWETITSI